MVFCKWFGGVLLGAALIAGGSAAAQSASPGWRADEVAVAPGAFVGGFDLLPNGDYAIFDGTAVVELAARDGAFVQTLHTPASPVFGAFLTLGPDGSKLYFGESSEGKVWEIDLATKQAVEVLDTVFPYDLAFDDSGRPWLSYAFGFSGGSFVALCDFTQGTLDDVIASPDASGPLAFDADGNLYTATPDTSAFPPPPDATEVLRFAPRDLQAGIGAGTIGVDAGELLGNVDGAAGIALDEAGDVLVSDANYGLLVDLDGVTHAETIVAQSGRPFAGFGYLRFAKGSKGVFEPWQPEEGGTLLAIHTDFFTFNGVTRVRPQRPQLATRPASPIPPGHFEFEISGAVPDGFGLMLITAAADVRETALRNRTWPAPLFLGLDLSAGVRIVPLATDSLGDYLESVVNPGLGGATLALQFIAGAAASGPFYGTSAPLEITLQ